MVEHIVLFKTRADATQEERERLVAGLLSLKGKIDGIEDATCGYNFSDRSQGYDVGFVVRFRDRASLEAYGPHPEHQKVVTQLVRPTTEGVIVVDYDHLGG